MSDELRAVRPEGANRYSWGGVCDGWRLVERPDLSVKRERVPPGAGETPHRHGAARQFFFVLSGEATLELDGRALTFGAGEGVEVPPGTPHRFCNRGAQEVHFLVVSTPSTANDRTAAPLEPPAPGPAERPAG